MPPVSPLEALVQGLQENREAQRKKALDVANQEADKFERQFKLDHAKQQAEYQQQELGIRQKEQERLTQEEMRRAAKDLDIKAHNERMDKARDAANDIREKLGESGLDAKKRIALMAQAGQVFREAIKGAADMAQAKDITTFFEMMFPGIASGTAGPAQGQVTPQDHQAAPGMPQVQPTSAAVPGQKPEYGSLDYLNSLVKPDGQAGQASPAAGMGPLPGPAAKVEKDQASKRASDELTRQRQITTNGIEAMEKSKRALTAAQVKNLEARTAKVPFDIAKDVADIQAHRIQADASMLNARTNAARERRVALESAAEKAEGSIKDKNNLLKEWKSQDQEASSLQKAFEGYAQKLAEANLAVNSPEVRANPAYLQTYTKRVGELTSAVNDARRRYLESDVAAKAGLVAVLKQGAIKSHKPGGAPDPEEDRRQIDAAREVLRKAQDLLKSEGPEPAAPPPVMGAPSSPRASGPNPPAVPRDIRQGAASIPPAGTTGEYARRSRQAARAGLLEPAPKKKAPLKKGAKGTLKNGKKFEVIGVH